jgi:hypothetical protein
MRLAVLGKFWRLPLKGHIIYSVRMKKILNNWTYQIITGFLEENGFDYYEGLEYSQVWVKGRNKDEPDRFVEVKFTQGFYSSKTLNRMIRQSGINENEWAKWASA